MKIALSFLSIFSLILFTICGTTACHTSSSNHDTASLMLHLHTNVDTNEVDSLGFLYPDGTGRSIGLTNAEFYISNITLTNANGSTYTLSSSFVLKVISNELYMVGSIPTGSYKSISFYVGVDPTTNASNPSSYAATSVLAPQTPPMWFGNTTQGYIFMSIQGTAKDAGGSAMPISYKIGSNALYQKVTLPVHSPVYTVTKNQTLTVHIICDYGKLLSSVTNFTSNTSTDTYTTNTALATTIANNIPNMFYYEE